MAGQSHAANHLQQGRLAAAVTAQDADALTTPHFEADVAQHPERFEVRLPPAEQDLFQPVVAVSVKLEGLAEVFRLDDDLRGRRR